MNSTTPSEISLPTIDIASVTEEISVIITFAILDIEISEGRYDAAA